VIYIIKNDRPYLPIPEKGKKGSEKSLPGKNQK